MKNIKNGFTLAEVLITLGIIGIVAAMTVPALITNTTDKTIGIALSKAVHDIESGLQNIIHIKNEEDPSIQTLDVIDDILTTADLFSTFSGATGTVDLQEANISYLNNAKEYSGDSQLYAKYGILNINEDSLAHKFPKSNAIFLFLNTSITELNDYANIHNGKINDDVVVARIIIDVNGAEGPNRLGKDIFLFGVENNGKLVPAGSAAYNNSISDDMNEELYTDAENGCSGDTVAGDGASCAARVVADGWKINYKK